MVSILQLLSLESSKAPKYSINILEICPLELDQECNQFAAFRNPSTLNRSWNEMKTGY